MEETKANNDSSRTTEQLIETEVQDNQEQQQEAKIDYLREYESINEAFPDENPE